ncbi:MAG: flagellar basal body rod C-terminal domain-containing protein, partial [Spirochaetota bacterium]
PEHRTARVKTGARLQPRGNSGADAAVLAAIIGWTFNTFGGHNQHRVWPIVGDVAHMGSHGIEIVGELGHQNDISTAGNARPQQVGKIQVVSFQNEQRMTQVGGGLLLTTEKPGPTPKDTKLAQGMIEESNVKPVAEITSMISILRQYQGIQKIADAEHNRQESMIQKLGRQA